MTSIIKYGIKLLIHSIQLLHQCSFGIDKWIQLTLYWAWDYLSMLVFKLIHISKRGPRLYLDKWNNLSLICTTNKDHIYYQKTPDFFKTFLFLFTKYTNGYWIVPDKMSVSFCLIAKYQLSLVLMDYQPFYYHAPVMHSHTTRSNFVWSTGHISIQWFDHI